MTLGLLPEPKGQPAGFIASSIINVTILALAVYVGMTAKQVLQQHYEMTTLIIPSEPPPPVKIKQPPPPEMPPPPEPPKVELQERQIVMPKPKPEPKPIEMEAKVNLPTVRTKPQVVTIAPEPKAALTAAMPAQNNQVKPSTAPVHLGQTFGATPNPNANRPATIAAIGNPYGGMQGPAVAPHGVVGSTGIGNGTHSGSNSGVVGKVASAGIPGSNGQARRDPPARSLRPEFLEPTQVAVAPKMVEQARSRPTSKCFRNLPCSTRAKLGSCASRGMWCCASRFSPPARWWCRAWCADWDMDWTKRPAVWRSRYVSVRPRATASRWI